MSELHVWTNDNDWVIAENASDAVLAMAENSGYHDLAEYQRDTDDSVSQWRQLRDDRLLPVTIEDEGEVKKTASEWAREHGRGWLAGQDC